MKPKKVRFGGKECISSELTEGQRTDFKISMWTLSVIKSISDHKARILRLNTLLQFGQNSVNSNRHVSDLFRDPKRKNSNLHSSHFSSSYLFS